MKTYISDSLISEALIVMQAMKQYNCFEISKVKEIRTYYGINKQAAINLAIQCEWLVETNGTCYTITPYGEELLKSFDGMQVRLTMYRDILYNYIKICKPIWARKIPYGRNEAYRIMSDEEQVCFKKAGLMNTPVTRDEVDWWDRIAEIERKKIELAKEESGRAGEELTIRYERNRTKSEPIWESIDSNLAGYDILSQTSESDTRQMLIEVKATTQGVENGIFYVTHNEWNFASAAYNRGRYYFYLWLLEDSPKLSVISFFEMQNHIPFDNGLGEWNEVAIPFAAFKTSFHVVLD